MATLFRTSAGMPVFKRGSSAVLVYAITALPFAFAIAFHVYILPQSRRSVTVMPHSDAA